VKQKITSVSPESSSAEQERESSEPKRIDDRMIEEIAGRLRDGKRIRRSLPLWGRLHIDRQLPFLCVYRHPADADDPGTAELVTGQASYLMASGDKRLHADLSRLVTRVTETLKEAFGSFLLLEVWPSNADDGAKGAASGRPTFRLVLPKKHSIGATVAAFEQALHDVEPNNETVDVEVETAAKVCPPHLPSLLSPNKAAALGCHVMGMEVRPIYRDAKSGHVFPLVHQELQRRMGAAYKRGFFDFTRRHTTGRPPHYHALGPRAMVKAVWTVDEQLARVSNGFDLLLSVTPTNAEDAWTAFRRTRFERAPEFIYRPLPMDPSLLKRQLFKVPIERIEDPTLAHLFLSQQSELDRKISLLAERGNPNFLLESRQLYGVIGDDLVDTALGILEHVPPGSRGEPRADQVDAQAFAMRVDEEIAYMRLTHPDIFGRAIVRKDVVGLMVSRGNVLIGRRLRMPAARVPAALAHEVGTHVLTYFNGRAQPFKQLSIGLPGYDELQEGIAVLAEYLTGGLNRPRLRLLAARVVAARRVIDGAAFVDVFRELDRTHGFTQRTAFTITMRVFRGGGFTKDAVYLRGLIELLGYLQSGGLLDLLFVGKFALQHVPIIKELQLRRVLGPPPLRPSYLDDPKALERLERARAGLTLPDLITRRKR
jgi:uncharacterized protein (TIGR02421 family)